MIKLYFPATALLQYVDATSIDELKKKIRDGKVSVLGTLLKLDLHEDVHTTIVMPAILKKYFKALRKKLAKSILGKDVILYFAKDYPIELDAEEEYLLVFEIKPEIANKLRIRKYAVAERFLIADLVFNLYYYVKDQFKDLVEKIVELERKILTFRQSARYELKMLEYTPFDFSKHRGVMNIHYPAILDGFISSNFPLLSKSGVIQMSLLLHVKERRFKDFFETIPEFSDPEVFISECVFQFERAFESYKLQLQRFIIELKEIIEEKDPIEQFILSNLPATFFDIYDKARSIGYDMDEVMLKLKDLIRRGIINVDREKLLK